MGEIINLNKARKAREKAVKEQKAGENRAKHGQTKSEKKSLSSTLEKLRRSLDGSKLDGPDEPPRPPKRNV
jgi:hypothetical protein